MSDPLLPEPMRGINLPFGSRKGYGATSGLLALVGERGSKTFEFGATSPPAGSSTMLDDNLVLLKRSARAYGKPTTSKAASERAPLGRQFS